MSGVGGRLVVVTGAAGSAGRPTTQELAAAGATVVAVGQSPQRLSDLAGQIPDIAVEVADLGDPGSVQHLARRIHSMYGPVDGIVHLVGGYRGGATFSANTDADWRFLDNGLIQTLRHVTLAFHDDLAASRAGRAVIVSGTAVDTPAAGSANYAAAKAAAEAWMRAFADSLRRSQSGRKTDPVPQTSAAVILVVKALVDGAMREAAPERKFPGFTDTADLAREIVALWARDAADLNGARIPLN